jgi:hypothetical protein
MSGKFAILVLILIFDFGFGFFSHDYFRCGHIPSYAHRAFTLCEAKSRNHEYTTFSQLPEAGHDNFVHVLFDVRASAIVTCRVGGLEIKFTISHFFFFLFFFPPKKKEENGSCTPTFHHVIHVHGPASPSSHAAQEVGC